MSNYATAPALTADNAPAVRTMDLSTNYAAGPRVTFGALALVELRKLVNTTTNKVLLWCAGGLLMAGVGLLALVGYMSSKRPLEPGEVQGQFALVDLVTGLSSVPTYILMVMAILTVTSEWSQRSVLTTFSLEPTRWRTLLAKFLAVFVLVLGVMAVVIATSYIALAVLQAFGVPVSYTFAADRIALFTFTIAMEALFACGIGLLFLNGPAAIVAVLMVPMFLRFASQVLANLKDYKWLSEWIAPNQSSIAIVNGTATAANWGYYLFHVAILTLIPLAIGIYRWMTKEAKTD